jgi:hypothetical protein
MNDHKKTGLLGCRLLNIDGTIQTSCRKFPDIITVIFKRINIFQIFPYAKKKVEAYIKPLSNYRRNNVCRLVTGSFFIYEKRDC